TVFKAKAIVKICGTVKGGAPDAGQPEIVIVQVDQKFPGDAKFTAFTPAANNPKLGDTVTVAGYGLTNPFAAAKDRKSTRGTVDLAVKELYKKETSFRVGDPAEQITKGVAPGDSGGPVTQGGNLVGIESLGWPYDPKNVKPISGNGVIASVPYALSQLT